MKQVDFRVATDTDECKKLWEEFSPRLVIDDEWDFRDIWTKAYDFPFHFIVGSIGTDNVGLLPLQLNTGKGLGAVHLHMPGSFLEFFGGIDIDDSRVLVKPGYEEIIPQLLDQIDLSAALTYLQEPYQIKGHSAEFMLDRFALQLDQLNDFSDFMQNNLDGKSRQRLINRINKIEREYKVTVRKGTDEDLEKLFQLSIDRFGERSSFNMPERKQVFRDFVKRFDTDLFTIEIDGEIKAVSLAIMYNHIYTTLSIGYDISVRDLSKYLIVQQMKRALEFKCKTFDAGKGDNGWKSHFNFQKIPQYKIILP